ncbi:MAG: T9SS type A sorting domain-containing protein [bacterium]
MTYTLRTALCISCLLMLSRIAVGQYGIDVDKSFGTGGTTELTIGGFNSEIAAFDVNHITKITTMAARLSLASSANYHIGMVRLDTAGKLDPTFGTGGSADLSWGQSDNVNAMQRQLENDSIYYNMYILGGSSRGTAVNEPSIYRIKANGSPDVSFGNAGKIVVKFADHSGGEVTNVVSDFGTRSYYVYGKSSASDELGKTGFGVARIKWNGTFDSSFGKEGKVIIPVPIHSVNGFASLHGTLQGASYSLVCGICDTGLNEIVIARVSDQGILDSSIGVNGIVRTGKYASATENIMAALQLPDLDKLLILLQPPKQNPTPVTICRFKSDGKPDSTYGFAGVSSNSIAPGIEPRGLNILNDGSAGVAGIYNSGLGHSIFTRVNDTTAVPDPKYFPNGIAVFDLDNGKYSNYLKFYTPTGKEGNCKKYIAVGGSIHDGVEYMMAVRFSTCPLAAVEPEVIAGDDFSIYPDPAGSEIKISTHSTLEDIQITDNVGTVVYSVNLKNSGANQEAYRVNVAHLPSGSYLCSVIMNGKKITKHFVVVH